MEKVRVHNNQSLVNIAVQHYGDANGILQLFADGQFDGFDDVPVAGSIIMVSTPLKARVKEFYREEISAGRMIAVATGVDVSVGGGGLGGSPWTPGFSPGYGGGTAYTTGFSIGFY